MSILFECNVPNFDTYNSNIKPMLYYQSIIGIHNNCTIHIDISDFNTYNKCKKMHKNIKKTINKNSFLRQLNWKKLVQTFSLNKSILIHKGKHNRKKREALMT